MARSRAFSSRAISPLRPTESPVGLLGGAEEHQFHVGEAIRDGGPVRLTAGGERQLDDADATGLGADGVHAVGGGGG